MKDGVLKRKYYGEDGSVTPNQVIIPKHRVPELLSTRHVKTNKYQGITKTIQECRAKYYFPGLARKIRAWVTSCPDYFANKRIDTRQIRPQMLSNTEFTMGPEGCPEVDIPTHRHDHGRLLTLPFCLPQTRHDSKNSGTMYNRRNDTTLLPTNRHPNGQRVTVQIGGSQSNSPNTRHTDKPRIDETSPNNQLTRKDSCLSKNFAQNINGR